MKTLIVAASLAALLAAATPSANAQSMEEGEAQCRPASAEPAARPRQRRPNALGGLFAAARDAGLGQALAGALGSSEQGRAAGSLLSGDVAGAAAQAAGYDRDPRRAQAAGALADVAVNMARSARDARACGADAADMAEPAPQDDWN